MIACHPSVYTLRMEHHTNAFESNQIIIFFMYQMFKKNLILFVREISVDWTEFKTDISLKNVIKSNSIALIFYLLKISFITHKEKDRRAYTQCTRIGILTPPTP